MDEGDGHATLAHATQYSVDGVVTHVTSREHARQAGLQGKWMAIGLIKTGKNFGLSQLFWSKHMKPASKSA
jgi:hypothetical protein